MSGQVALMDDVVMICEGIICKTCVEMDIEKGISHLKEWCPEHFWAPSCFHGLLGMAEMSLKSIFLNNIPMNTIEKNNEDFSYRPRYYFVRGIPVSEGDGILCAW